MVGISEWLLDAGCADEIRHVAGQVPAVGAFFDLPALSTRGHGLVHDYLLDGVGPVIVGPESQGLPSLDASTTRDGESTTYRAIADKVLKEHEDEVETKFEDLGLHSPTRGFIESLMGAPSGLDADLARVIRGLEDGSINALIE